MHAARSGDPSEEDLAEQSGFCLFALFFISLFLRQTCGDRLISFVFAAMDPIVSVDSLSSIHDSTLIYQKRCMSHLHVFITSAKQKHPRRRKTKF